MFGPESYRTVLTQTARWKRAIKLRYGTLFACLHSPCSCRHERAHYTIADQGFGGGVALEKDLQEGWDLML